jgi:hypothetical protein
MRANTVRPYRASRYWRGPFLCPKTPGLHNANITKNSRKHYKLKPKTPNNFQVILQILQNNTEITKNRSNNYNLDFIYNRTVTRINKKALHFEAGYAILSLRHQGVDITGGKTGE